LSQGFASNIYCLDRDLELEDESELFAHFPEPDEGDITLFHFALPSPMTEAFKKLPEKKVLIYHNITPAEFFEE